MINKTHTIYRITFLCVLFFLLIGCGEKSTEIEETIYTRTAPGPWQGKEDSHVPAILVGKTDAGLEVQVSVNHVMDPDIPHYIMWLKLYDENETLLGETQFEPDSETPTVTFSIAAGPQKIKALEKCNLHGIWSAEIELE